MPGGSDPRAAVQAGAVEVLSDEVLEHLCSCLPGRELLNLAATSQGLHRLASNSAVIWGHLSSALLGEPLCCLHQALATRRKRGIDAAFWRTLFRRGYEFKAALWSLDLRAAFVDSVRQGCPPAPSSSSSSSPPSDAAQSLITGSGHCTVGLGSLVVKVGGLRPDCRREQIHACVFDLESLTLSEVQLEPGSAPVERRLRHAACEVSPAFATGSRALLVLGGCNDQTRQPCAGGLRVLNILQVLSPDGRRGRWHVFPATGCAPGAIWHHICGSFAKGKRVVVFGGDIPADDPEFAAIEIRSLPAGFVFVLDVDRRTWERVATSGPAPTWRSLHAGITHRDVMSHSERLVILGGCAEHLPIFSSSNQLEEMRGHALDLGTFTWVRQPAPEARGRWRGPPPRLRLATEKFGEWLLLYGGHGTEDRIGERGELHKLNLRTLRWGAVAIRGREWQHPAAPAATLTSGLVLGGISFGPFGVSPVPKLDVLVLCPEDAGSAEACEEEAVDRAVAAAHGREDSAEGTGDDEELVQVAIRLPPGGIRRVVMRHSLLRQLLARRAAAELQADDAEGSDAEAQDEPVEVR